MHRIDYVASQSQPRRLEAGCNKAGLNILSHNVVVNFFSFMKVAMRFVHCFSTVHIKCS